MISSLGPVPLSKVDFIETLDAYAKCHFVADTIRATYCVNTPAASGNLKSGIRGANDL